MRIAQILTIFGPNQSRGCKLKFEKFSNERRRYRGIGVVVVAVVVVAVIVVVDVVVVVVVVHVVIVDNGIPSCVIQVPALQLTVYQPIQGHVFQKA